jgi:hypothetical protein
VEGKGEGVGRGKGRKREGLGRLCMEMGKGGAWRGPSSICKRGKLQRTERTYMLEDLEITFFYTRQEC